LKGVSLLQRTRKIKPAATYIQNKSSRLFAAAGCSAGTIVKPKPGRRQTCWKTPAAMASLEIRAAFKQNNVISETKLKRTQSQRAEALDR
jgi:hypothetical protein